MADGKRKKRIGGANFWRLFDAVKEVTKAQQEWQEWLKEEARKHGVYMDEISAPLAGMVTKLNEKGEMEKRYRLPDKFIEEAEKRFQAVIKAAEKMRDVRVDLAHLYNTHPSAINVETGEINDEFEIAEPTEGKGEKK